MSKHPRARSANLSELPCSGGTRSSRAYIHLFSFVAYVSCTLCIACTLGHCRSCCSVHTCTSELSTRECFHACHDLLFLKNITPLFFLPFSPPFAFLHFLYCNIYFYDNSKSNKNRTLPDWLGGTLFIYSRPYRSLERPNTLVLFP